MRMRILKKHGTGIPDVILACLTEHLKGLDVASKASNFSFPDAPGWFIL